MASLPQHTRIKVKFLCYLSWSTTIKELQSHDCFPSLINNVPVSEMRGTRFITRGIQVSRIKRDGIRVRRLSTIFLVAFCENRLIRRFLGARTIRYSLSFGIGVGSGQHVLSTSRASLLSYSRKMLAHDSQPRNSPGIGIVFPYPMPPYTISPYLLTPFSFPSLPSRD